MSRERPWTLQQRKNGAYWSVVHNSENDHHHLFLGRLIPLPSSSPHLLKGASPIAFQYCYSFSPLFSSCHYCPSLLQVRGGEQGLFGCCANARRPGEGLGHVGRLPGKHFRQRPPAPLGGFCHYLLPPRLPPPKWEQVSQVLGKGEIWKVLPIGVFLCVIVTYIRHVIRNGVIVLLTLEKRLMM